MPSLSTSGVTVVIATYNRAASLQRTLERLAALPERPPVIVVDNGSRDATAEVLAGAPATVSSLTMSTNIGAAARTHGVEAARSPYVAFCDDDCWWAEGSLPRAAALLDGHGDVALLNARVLVNDEARLDPACRLMSLSDLPKTTACPGRTIAAYMAGACIMRRDAFLGVGGYHRRYHLGAEESLVALDLLAAGHAMIYCPDLVLHHYPSAAERNPDQRRRLVLRNRLWTTWLRHRTACAIAATAATARAGVCDPVARAALLEALCGLPWVLRERRPVPRSVERLVDRLALLPA
ncbi:MAG: glycosyltransferase family 2 protein [Candidatus Eremiobacteraeota bacterium]|nr:glycosyltransferase family 2 protein [Candidatus Eremiobacteraeota bacterium]MBC5801722.1 glycosyltransferase family 2 protein [Candidatus Eremiobacteraeota bacterium]MBC5822478.1 glycosyltransferase family 2 protein [Candidatus Eremiobacteraeota bacterium]